MTDATRSPSSGSENSDSLKGRVSGWLWNPFVSIGGGPALGIGLIAILVTGGIAMVARIHFDGVLDLHIGAVTPWWFYLGEGIIDWLSLALVLWVVGLMISPKGRKFRAIDLFGTQALARWPLSIAALGCLFPGFERYTNQLIEMVRTGGFSLSGMMTDDAFAFWGVTLLSLFCLIWFIALAWKSFRISCDAKGVKAIAGFVIGLVIAEVVSKIALSIGLVSLI